MTRRMKDSGVEWIGEIPESWDVVKFKNIGTYINGYAFKPEDWTTNGKKIVRIQDLTGSNDNPNFYDGIIDEKYNIQRGDYLISWAATLDAFIWDNDDAWLNQHIFKAIPKNNVTNKFFFWLIKESMQNMNNENKHGIMMQHVTLSVFNNFNIPLPPKNEQQKIANYLDEKCSAIDEVIAKTEQSVEEYKKLKQSVITEAITKGIRPNRKMKSSGVEWIGDIPEKWNVRKLFQVFTQVKNKNQGMVETNLLSLSYGKIKQKNIETSFGLLPESFETYNIIDKNDIVLRLTDLQNDQKSLRVGLSTQRGIITSAYVTMRAKNPHMAPYLYYLLHTFDIEKGFYGMGDGVRQGLNWDELKHLSFVLPPLSEQKEIADYLDKKCAEIDSLIEKKQQFLTELAIYKKSMIYEYVTGKKEVA